MSQALSTGSKHLRGVSQALSGQELIDVAADCHILGIRSKTTLTKEASGRSCVYDSLAQGQNLMKDH